MHTRLLPLSLVVALAITGAGCRQKTAEQQPVTLPTPPPIASDIVETGVMRLTGSAGEIAFDLELMRIPWGVSGTFTYTKNSVTKTGTVFNSEDSAATSNLLLVAHDDEELGYLLVIWPTTQTNTLNATWTAKGSANPVNVVLATQPAAHAMRVAVAELAHKDPTSNNDICSFTSAYPLLEDTEPNARAINLLIEKTVVGTLSEDAAIAPLEQRASEYVANCVGEIQSLLNEFGSENAPTLAYVSDSSASVTLNDEELISLRFDGYDYTGGAHGNPSLQGLTIQTTTGKALSLKDLFKGDRLQALITKERQILLGVEQGEYLYEETSAEFQSFVSQAALPEAAQLAQFGDESNFYLTESGIVLYHTAYEIAPYAAGQFETMIPYSEIKELIREDGPLSKYVK